MKKLFLIMVVGILLSGAGIADDSLEEATPPIFSPDTADAVSGESSTGLSGDTDALANTSNEEGEHWSDPDENGFWGSFDGTGGGEDDFQAFEENGE